MAKGKFKKNKYKKIKLDRDDPKNARPNKFKIVKENEAFNFYYKAQNLMKDDEEFELFLNTLRDYLPISFRINQACFGQTQALKNIVESDEFSVVLDTDGANKGLTKLKWYPNQLAYQLNTSRVEIRDSEILQKLHNFLISETENGYISRQETVSFIPPILLGVQPHHRILDMCAAPGSKTTQLIEYLHGKSHLDFKNIDSTQGFVVANDINNSRCYMLVHQCKRLNLPYFFIVNHDAATMPNFYTNVNGKKEKLKFDRILADVPCTGDGTLRKNIEIWSKWHVQNGNHIHFIQLRIAKRAAEMLAIDGIMVYSTCSLNPIENEAVVRSLLRQADGALELVDVEDKITHLKHLNGLENWAVMQKDLKILSCPEDADSNIKTQLSNDMFPPTDPEKYNLKRCIRILPHYQNTGGFFIAVIKKIRLLPWEKQKEDENEANKVDKKQDKVDEKEKKNLDKDGKRPRFEIKDIRAFGFRENPFVFVTKDDPVWLKIKEYYSISDDFPSHRLFYRSEKDLNHLYYITESAIDLYNNNAFNINFINFGVRAFSKIQDKVASCSHRIAQDGLNLIYPYLDKTKIIKVTKEEFEKIIKCEEYMNLTELNEKLIDQINQFPSGCIVLEYNHPVKQDDGTYKDVVVPFICWKGKSTIRPFVNKDERCHYMRIFGFDLTTAEAGRKKIFEERKQRKIERLKKFGQKNESNNELKNTDEQIADEEGDLNEDIKDEDQIAMNES